MMKKREIRKFIRRCNNGAKEAKKATTELSKEQIIEIRANIKSGYVKFDRWGLFLSFVALAIAVLALADGKVKEKSNVILGCAGILLMAALIALILYFVDQSLKTRRIKALSYLDDYVNKSIEFSANLHDSGAQCETIEQIRERHKEELIQNLEQWKKQKDIVQKQIELYEAELNKDCK